MGVERNDHYPPPVLARCLLLCLLSPPWLYIASCMSYAVRNNLTDQHRKPSISIIRRGTVFLVWSQFWGTQIHAGWGGGGGVAIKGRKIEVSYAFRVSFEQRAVHLQRCKLSKLTAWSIQDLPQMNLEWILFTSMILTTGRSVHTETLTARFSSCFYLMLRENTGLVKMSFFFTALELLHLLYHFTVLPEQW